MLSVREAIDIFLPRFAPLGSERVALLDATDRVLAQALSVQNDLPEFDHSAMDGYALAWSSAQSQQTLQVSAEIRAGDRPQPLAANTAARIFTGAPMPPGADTVLMQEDAIRTGAEISLRCPIEQGANVRARASEYRAGAALFDVGTLLGPSEIGLLAAQGHAEIEVFRKPRVAILPTGNELRPLGAPAAPYTIIDSNTYALSAALTRAGCIPVPLGIAVDDREIIRSFVDRGLTFDALITVGGVSVGDYDLVSEVLRAAAVHVEFHKVAIKPGKPLLFGTYDNGTRATPVIGLPGNPVSALVVFEVFVRPGLMRMQGHRDLFPQPIEVTLANSYNRKPGRTEFVRAKLESRAGGWLAHIRRQQGSGAMSSLTAGSALVIAPRERGRLEAGETLKAILPSLPRRSDPGFAD
ncbi:MAG TPA: gephyrin-like molybdotransferase Glp [Polyangiales bacterium]|nr:gephyrin-like molybdotransferase Glp [Polyangiales bacterium]